MRSREKVLEDLSLCVGELPKLLDELRTYNWDIERPLVQLSAKSLGHVLKKVLDNEITNENLEDWANAVECREDLAFDNEKTKQIIIELANPSLYEPLSVERITYLIADISAQDQDKIG